MTSSLFRIDETFLSGCKFNVHKIIVHKIIVHKICIAHNKISFVRQSSLLHCNLDIYSNMKNTFQIVLASHYFALYLSGLIIARLLLRIVGAGVLVVSCCGLAVVGCSTG
jgi:hypothetical protein